MSGFCRNPTPQQVLGIHFDKARNGELKYLNLNTTYNTSILLNYRQTESAFWTQYLPTVVGRLVPTYPPSTEFWWEPREPLQIAFWSMAATSMFLMVIVVMCCILWRNAKRYVRFALAPWFRRLQSNLYYKPWLGKLCCSCHVKENG